MLDHPWLSMPDEYNYHMSDLEYRKYKLRQTVEIANQDFLFDEYKGSKKKENFIGARKFESNVSELADDDSDINAGDDEDNITLNSDDLRDLSFNGNVANDEEEEFNLNVSFTGGYVPNTDLTRVDKGQGNPQFA
jgi:hypothetical protein